MTFQPSSAHAGISLTDVARIKDNWCRELRASVEHTLDKDWYWPVLYDQPYYGSTPLWKSATFSNCLMCPDEFSWLRWQCPSTDKELAEYYHREEERIEELIRSPPKALMVEGVVIVVVKCVVPGEHDQVLARIGDHMLIMDAVKISSEHIEHLAPSEGELLAKGHTGYILTHGCVTDRSLLSSVRHLFQADENGETVCDHTIPSWGVLPTVLRQCSTLRTVQFTEPVVAAVVPQCVRDAMSKLIQRRREHNPWVHHPLYMRAGHMDQDGGDEPEEFRVSYGEALNNVILQRWYHLDVMLWFVCCSPVIRCRRCSSTVAMLPRCFPFEFTHIISEYITCQALRGGAYADPGMTNLSLGRFHEQRETVVIDSSDEQPGRRSEEWTWSS